MMIITPGSTRFPRLWRAVIEASAAMVAIHYAAPWNTSASRRADDRQRRDHENCAA
jgi:hypothetical protein